MTEKRGVGQPPHVPTEENRAIVRELAACGVPQDRIARRIRLCVDTLHKYYMDDYDDAKTKAGSEVGKSLYNKAIDGDATCMIFYLKTQMQWSDKPKDDEDSLKTLSEQIAAKLKGIV